MDGVSRSELGEFLRARRAAVTPGSVGLPDVGRRRVPGLRREEVAMLVTCTAEPGSPSARALDLLGSMIATGRTAVGPGGVRTEG
jgi:hypothetical protein